MAKACRQAQGTKRRTGQHQGDIDQRRKEFRWGGTLQTEGRGGDVTWPEQAACSEHALGLQKHFLSGSAGSRGSINFFGDFFSPNRGARRGQRSMVTSYQRLPQEQARPKTWGENVRARKVCGRQNPKPGGQTVSLIMASRGNLFRPSFFCGSYPSSFG